MKNSKKENHSESQTDIPEDPSNPGFVEPVPSPNMKEDNIVNQLK